MQRRQLEAGGVVDSGYRKGDKVMKEGAESRRLEPALKRGDAEQPAGYVLQYLDGVQALQPKSDHAINCIQRAGQEPSPNNGVKCARRSCFTSNAQVGHHFSLWSLSFCKDSRGTRDPTPALVNAPKVFNQA